MAARTRHEGAAGDDGRHWPGVAATIAAIAIPLALIGLTLGPLAPPPRGNRPAAIRELTTPTPTPAPTATPKPKREERRARDDDERREGGGKKARERAGKRGSPVPATAAP